MKAQVKTKTGPVRGRKISILHAPNFDLPYVVHGFSTRAGGVSTVFGGRDLNLGKGKHESAALVDRNRKLFLDSIGGAGMKLQTLRQVHSSIIHRIEKISDHVLSGDGLITNTPGILLSVQVADCVPVLLLDPAGKAAGAFHAGWRGTAQRIVEKGVGLMRMAYGSDPEQMQAAIGPCIGACCYEIGEEVIDEFQSQFDYAPALFREVFDKDPVKRKYPLLFMTQRAPGHSDLGRQIHLDLVEANRRQLLAAGVQPQNIWSAGLCTSCNLDRLFSYRKEGGFTGRMMGVLGMREPPRTR